MGAGGLMVIHARGRAALAAAAVGLVLAALPAAAGAKAPPRQPAPARTSGGARTGPAPSAARLDSLYALWRPLLAETVGRGGEPRDVYKLIYQGVMGPAHAAVDRARVLADLRGECNLMEAAPQPEEARGTPVLEPVRPDSQLVRVNLWPLLRRIDLGLSRDQQAQARDEALERLALAFSRTAGEWNGDLRLVRGLWSRAAEDERLWGDSAARAHAVDFTAELAKAGWPAAHHSDSWTSRYLPHYRVVSRALVPPSWGGPVEPRRPGEEHAPGSERPRREDQRGQRVD